MAITQSAETILSKLSTISVTSGQVIYVRDAQQLYFDSLNGTRIQVTDIIFLNTDADRTAIMSPLEKLYYVIGTGVLWIYNGSAWVSINSVSSSYSTNLITSSWSGSSAPYTFTIAAGTHNVGANPVVSVYDTSGNLLSVGINVGSTGTVTLSTNQKINCRIVIN